MPQAVPRKLEFISFVPDLSMLDADVPFKHIYPTNLDKLNLNNYEETQSKAKYSPYEPKNLIKLLMVKELFCQELPRMPRDYITRLVFDPHHQNLVIFEKPEKPGASAVAGSICFRLFQQVGLAEIAFCAVSGQRKFAGLGRKMMNELKNYVSKLGITDIVTYADNSAVEYFRKQGFSTQIRLPDEAWYGRIKHYEGAQFMHCMLYSNVDYVNLPNRIVELKKMLLKRCGIETEPTRNDLENIQSLQFAKKHTSLDIELSPADEVKKCCVCALKALQQEAGKIHSIPFLTKMQEADFCQVAQNNIELMINKARSDYYRTPEIFFADCQSISDRCIGFNGDNAEITALSAQFVQSIKRAFQKEYTDYNSKNKQPII